MKHKLFSILALLLMAVTGAVAQTETLLTTITATAVEQASYSTEGVATVSFSGSSSYYANWGWWGYGWTATVTPDDGYTITKCVFYANTGDALTDDSAPFTAETTSNDKTPVVNGTQFNKTPIEAKGITKIEVYGYVTPTATTYTVTLKDGTEDAANWTITPTTAEEGQTVTITYNGTKKVKSIKAVKKDATIAVTSIAIDNAPTEALFVNSTGTLTATVSPDNATDKTVTWSSSDPDYVKIDANTGEYTIMGTKGYGSATITATAGDKTATCTITGKVTYTSLSAGTVLHVGDTFYAGKVYFNTSPLVSFQDSNGAITVVEDNGYYKFQRGSNGTKPNVTSYQVKDNTDGIYIVSGSGTSSDKFVLAVHTVQ